MTCDRWLDASVRTACRVPVRVCWNVMLINLKWMAAIISLTYQRRKPNKMVTEHLRCITHVLPAISRNCGFHFEH